MTQLIELDFANPLICTWTQLLRALAPLHQWEKAEVERLHDVYVNSVPAPDYTVAVPGKPIDERHPRPGDHFNHIMNPLALSAWIQDVSAKRGYPYDARTALNITQGKGLE